MCEAIMEITKNNFIAFKYSVSIIFMMLLMVLTRGYQSASYLDIHLPDFTLAAIFITGVYFKNFLAPVPLIIVAVLIDWVSISYYGASNFCVTQAYVMLLPAYYLMYLVARSLTSLKFNSLKQVLLIAMTLLVAISLEWLITSASFYWMSPYFPDANLAGFALRIEKYAPGAVTNFFYWMIASCAFFSLNSSAKQKMLKNKFLKH